MLRKLLSCKQYLVLRILKERGALSSRALKKLLNGYGATSSGPSFHQFMERLEIKKRIISSEIKYNDGNHGTEYVITSKGLNDLGFTKEFYLK